MPQKKATFDVDDAIQRYQAGESVDGLARSLGLSTKPIRRVLREHNIPVRRLNAPWSPADPDGLIARYQSGESINAIVASLGVTRTPVTRWLRSQGVTTRSPTEANRLLAASRSPEEHAANTTAAHEAVRGKRQTVEHRTRIALTREQNRTGASPAELLLCEWLTDLRPVPQKAVGPYNVDVAVGTIAVEIFGGHWHAHGRHAARTEERARYILNAGWTLLVVWVTGRHRLKRDITHYIRTLNEDTRRDPSIAGQYRVVWGDGQDVTESCPDLDQLALVPAAGSRKNSRP